MIFNYHYMYSLIDKRYTLSRGRLLCRVFHIFRRERNILCFVPNAAPPLQKAAKNAPSNTMTALFSVPTAVKGYLPPRQKFLSETPLIVCIAAASLIVGGSVHELSQVKSQKDAIEQSKYDRALQEYLSTPTTGDLTILSDWTTRTSRNYLYIEGTVKNTSSKDVRYYKIGSNFWTAAEMSSTSTGQTARIWTPVIPSDLRACTKRISATLTSGYT